MSVVRRDMGAFSRSTIIHVRNWTDGPLRLRSKEMNVGWFVEGLGQYQMQVPREIPAGAEAVFACRGRTFPPSGVEGEVLFSDRGADIGFKLGWFNPISSGANGRYCETELMDLAGAQGSTALSTDITLGTLTTRPELRPQTDVVNSSSHITDARTSDPHPTREDYIVTVDDDDQTVNGEVYFDVKYKPKPKPKSKKRRKQQKSKRRVSFRDSDMDGDPGDESLMPRTGSSRSVATDAAASSAGSMSEGEMDYMTDEDSAVDESEQVLMRGWVSVKPATDWTWARRWGVLTRHEGLVYYGSATEKVKIGQASIWAMSRRTQTGMSEMLLEHIPSPDYTDRRSSNMMAVAAAGATAPGDADAGPSRSADLIGGAFPLRLWFQTPELAEEWDQALMLASPLLNCSHRVASLDIDSALEELAQRSIKTGLDLDQLLSLYHRAIHGDDEAAAARLAKSQPSTKASSGSPSLPSRKSLGQDTSAQDEGRSWGQDLHRLGTAEAKQAMVLLLLRLLAEEHLRVAREMEEFAVPVEVAARQGISHGGTPLHFSGNEWIELLAQWTVAPDREQSGRTSWHDLHRRMDALLAGQRLLSLGLLAPASAAGNDCAHCPLAKHLM